MSEAPAPELWLVRHGETEWSRDHKHTSVTDLPLTEVGEAAALALRERLAATTFDLVLTSPRQRARRTAELAGFPGAEVDDDLVEWAYGDYEGITTATIRESVPGWTVWTHPSPDGETAADVTRRLDRVVHRVKGSRGRTLAFAHGHSLRALAARWLEQPVQEGRFFRLDTSTVSVLGFERETPVILSWNA
ncbi:histidine phosphatase family protein [Nocardioides seonyuensis]|uniref:Histidine phosphatase family protein n=1 Tax=Nocardioides seonyuensis TaxID=2518371 RepID=A0A4P7IKA2_9ACTN|nr:histidine phosphatase family protein [Nocardioides seonyuensis]QBX56371.1 histidine phosphatase family protein [Nocardioides seonyuensis]